MSVGFKMKNTSKASEIKKNMGSSVVSLAASEEAIILNSTWTNMSINYVATLYQHFMNLY